jgi:hypothetical protein
LAPSRAKSTAHAFPLPHPGPTEPAPTINATLFSSLPIIHSSNPNTGLYNRVDFTGFACEASIRIAIENLKNVQPNAIKNMT